MTTGFRSVRTAMVVVAMIVLLGASHASVTKETVPPGPALPPPTNGYVVFTYSGEGALLGIISVGLDLVYPEEGETYYRDPKALKASVLNAACVPSHTDPTLRRFCDRKSYLWCEGAVQSVVNEGSPRDQQLQPHVFDFCQAYNLLAAGDAVRFAEAKAKTPADLTETTLVCVCSGHASWEKPVAADPIDGPCGNRINCRLTAPAAKERS